MIDLYDCTTSQANLISLTEDTDYWYYEIGFENSFSSVTGIVTKCTGIKNIKAHVLSLISKHNARHEARIIGSSHLIVKDNWKTYTHGSYTEDLKSQFL